MTIQVVVQAPVASIPELDTSLDGIPALAMDMLMFHAGISFTILLQCHAHQLRHLTLDKLQGKRSLPSGSSTAAQKVRRPMSLAPSTGPSKTSVTPSLY